MEAKRNSGCPDLFSFDIFTLRAKLLNESTEDIYKEVVKKTFEHMGVLQPSKEDAELFFITQGSTNKIEYRSSSFRCLANMEDALTVKQLDEQNWFFDSHDSIWYVGSVNRR